MVYDAKCPTCGAGLPQTFAGDISVVTAENLRVWCLGDPEHEVVMDITAGRVTIRPEGGA